MHYTKRRINMKRRKLQLKKFPHHEHLSRVLLDLSLHFVQWGKIFSYQLRAKLVATKWPSYKLHDHLGLSMTEIASTMNHNSPFSYYEVDYKLSKQCREIQTFRPFNKIQFTLWSIIICVSFLELSLRGLRENKWRLSGSYAHAPLRPTARNKVCSVIYGTSSS